MKKLFFLFIILYISIISCSGKKKKTVKPPVEKSPVEHTASITEKFEISGEMAIPFCMERSLKEKIIFVISKYCPHCRRSRPILEKVINDNKLSKYYVFLDLANEKDRDKLDSFGITVIYTPTLIINCSSYIGSKPEKKYLELVKKFKESSGIKRDSR